MIIPTPSKNAKRFLASKIPKSTKIYKDDIQATPEVNISSDSIQEPFLEKEDIFKKDKDVLDLDVKDSTT